MVKFILFLFASYALILNVKCSEEETDQNFRTELQELQEFTKQLEKNLKELKDEQTNVFSDVQAKLAELENKVGALEDRNEKEGSRLSMSGLNGSSEMTEEIHTKIARLHQQHGEQLETMRQQQAHLNNTVTNLHGNVHRLTTMHDITQRLQLAADLIVQERWYEALLHWSFAENHIVHDVDSDANVVLSDYLRQVITFAYTGHGAGADRLSRLYPIFDFVHKLSNKQYKVYAYETLVKHMLESKDIFDGTEIFILASHVRRVRGMNSKAHRVMPAITQVIGSGSSVHLVYIGDAYNSSHNLRNRNKLNETDTLDLHTHASMMVRKNEVKKSLEYPIYASKHYKPYYSGTWTPIYRNSSYFLIQNAANAGYLNVPSAEDGKESLLNCVIEPNVQKYNIEFSFVYIDAKSFTIRSAALDKDVIITECPMPEGNGTTFCITVDNSDSGQKAGSKFSAITVVAASI